MPRYRIDNFSAGQNTSSGPFAVKENELRLALNADLKKRRGALMRRDGYTQVGSAISANQMLGMASFLAQPTVNYAATALPAAASPAWTKTATGSPTENAAGGLLTTVGSTTTTQYYTKGDTALDNATGTTVEIRVKATTLATNDSSASGTFNFGISIEDGTRRVNLRFYIVSGVEMIMHSVNANGGNGIAKTLTDAYHVIRLTLQGTTSKLYFDGLFQSQTTVEEASASKQIIFGDTQATSFAHEEIWDYVKYWNYGAFAPGNEPDQGKLLLANYADLYTLAGATFTDITATQLTPGKPADMVEFNNKLFVCNGYDALRTTQGSAPVLTGDADNAPVFKYIERFFDRIYGIYSDDYPDTVWWSSLPMDLITNVKGAHTTATTLNVASTKYIKAGDIIDVYTHATNTKVTVGGDSNTVSAVPSETTLTVSSITCADNDDVYIEDTKGTLGIKWDTSGLPGEDYEKFPGETMVGGKRYGDYLMIGAKSSMWAFDKYQNKTQISATAGTTAGRSMAVVNGQFFYFNQLGIYRWTGAGEPELISSAIQDFIDAVDTSFLTSVVGFADQDSYCLYVDDLTVDGRTYTNVLVEYNTADDHFILHTLQDTITCATSYAPPPGDTKYVYLGTSDGELHRWRNGTSDDGTVIHLEVETVDHFITSPEDIKQIDKLWVFATTPGRAALSVSVDGGEFKDLGDIKDNITKMICNLTGSYFKFRIVHSETVSPQIDAIILNYKVQGEK